MLGPFTWKMAYYPRDMVYSTVNNVYIKGLLHLYFHRIVLSNFDS